MRTRRKNWEIWLLIFVCAVVWSGVAPAETANAAASGMIRVKLTRLGSPSSITMTTVGGYSVNGKSIASGSTVRVSASGGSVSVTANGSSAASGSSVTLKRGSGGTGCGVRFTSPSLSNLFCGDLTFTASGSSITTVISMYVETYLYGVVAYEMSNSYPLEALKAQAVAARTFAMKNQKGTGVYDVTDTTSYQVFRGYNSAFGNVVSAVNATKGMCLTYGGGYITAAYSASNGGYTMSNTAAWGGAALPYLPAKADPYDLECPTATVKSARIPMTPTASDPLNASLNTALKSALGVGGGAVITKILDLTAHTEKSGANTGTYKYIRFTVEVRDGSGTRQMKCDLPTYGKLESMFGLSIMNSTPETVAAEKGEGCFYIRFRRFGHGVGMSQEGARWMAKQYGKTSAEILNYYYPGAKLVTVQLYDSVSGSRSSGTGDGTSYPEGTLFYGMSGDEVKKLQTRLKELGYFSGAIGGNYKDQTVAAVAAFQADMGLEADGVATPKVQKLIYAGQAPAAPAATAAPAGTAAPTQSQAGYKTLKKGDSGTAVKHLQARLRELGYFTGDVTGKYLDQTVSAVKRYQKARGLTVDGVATASLQEKLFSEEAKATPAPTAAPTAAPTPAATATKAQTDEADKPLRQGDSGTAVKRLQARLRKLGYFTGSVDGKYQKTTAAAVKAFQKKMKLSQTGRADAETLALLYAPGTPKSTTTLKTAYAKSSGAVLRASAGEDGKQLASIPAGGKVKVLCKLDGWTRVQYGTKVGYVPAGDLTGKK